MLLARSAVALVVIIMSASLLCPSTAQAQKEKIELGSREKGQSTGLPIPRFVSLKANEVNVRRGPGWDHAIAWVFRRAGLPVEIIAEFDVWRQVRDSEGATGWVIGSLLSGRRTVLVAPWEDKTRILDLHEADDKYSRVAARLSPGVLGDVHGCDGSWCEITAGSVTGYIAQDLVWGAYPGETIE